MTESGRGSRAGIDPVVCRVEPAHTICPHGLQGSVAQARRPASLRRARIHPSIETRERRGLALLLVERGTEEAAVGQLAVASDQVARQRRQLIAEAVFMTEDGCARRQVARVVDEGFVGRIPERQARRGIAVDVAVEVVERVRVGKGSKQGVPVAGRRVELRRAAKGS